MVSTHSRPKAAANSDIKLPKIDGVSTHSRPKAAAGLRAAMYKFGFHVSTHSRPKAAAPYLKKQEKSAD